MPKLSKDKLRLLTNTLMLYALRFSTYFFGLIALPYQARVLPPAVIGSMGVASSLMYYFYLIIDFGFILSATETVTRQREDKKMLGRLLTSVYAVKATLSLVCLPILAAVLVFIPAYQSFSKLVLAYFVATLIDGFLPDFLYRGLEDMSPITYRTVAVKALFVALMFGFLRGPGDIYVVPLLNAAGSLLAVIWSLTDLRRRHGIRFERIGRKDYFQHFNYSGSFFLSRIASTVYSSLNTLIIGSMCKVRAAQYSMADKLMSTGRSALSPIADSIYPYMIKNRDFRLIRKILLITTPPIALFCTLVWIYAGDLCVLFFGDEVYRHSGDILRAFLPAAVFTLPDYLLGFPCLGALGANKHANYSIYVSCAVHLIGLGLLWSGGQLTAVNMAACSSVAVGVELAYRVIIVKLTIKKLHKGKGEESPA